MRYGARNIEWQTRSSVQLAVSAFASAAAPVALIWLLSSESYREHRSSCEGGPPCTRALISIANACLGHPWSNTAERSAHQTVVSVQLAESASESHEAPSFPI